MTLILKKKVEIEKYVENIRQISAKIKNNCLLIIQSTLPPGTTEKVLKPIIAKTLKREN